MMSSSVTTRRARSSAGGRRPGVGAVLARCAGAACTGAGRRGGETGAGGRAVVRVRAAFVAAGTARGARAFGAGRTLAFVVRAVTARVGRAGAVLRDGFGRAVARRAAGGRARRAGDALRAGRRTADFFRAAGVGAGFFEAVFGGAAFFARAVRDVLAPARRRGGGVDARLVAEPVFPCARFRLCAGAPFRLAIAWVLSVTLTVSDK